jgi:hypothetical protein
LEKELDVCVVRKRRRETSRFYIHTPPAHDTTIDGMSDWMSQFFRVWLVSSKVRELTSRHDCGDEAFLTKADRDILGPLLLFGVGFVLAEFTWISSREVCAL